MRSILSGFLRVLEIEKEDTFLEGNHLLTSAYGGHKTNEHGKVWCYMCEDWVSETSFCPQIYEVSTCGLGRG